MGGRISLVSADSSIQNGEWATRAARLRIRLCRARLAIDSRSDTAPNPGFQQSPTTSCLVAPTMRRQRVERRSIEALQLMFSFLDEQDRAVRWDEPG